MRTRDYPAQPEIAVTFMLLAGCAARADPVGVTGVVASVEGRRVEGVVVSAKQDGSNSSRSSVGTDAHGATRSPPAGWSPAAITLAERAAGYELPGKSTATLAAAGGQGRSQAATRSKNLFGHLTKRGNTMSMPPGPDEQKKFWLNCTGRPHARGGSSNPNTDADEFTKVHSRA